MDLEELDLLMLAFFAIFYVDDAYLTTRDPNFLQVASNSLVSLFERVGLETNVKKTQAMICTPSQISNQLSTNSYRHRHGYGTPTREQWDARTVECRQCQATMYASSLSRHLAYLHEVCQQTVVVEELLYTKQACCIGPQLWRMAKFHARTQVVLGNWDQVGC